MKEGVGKQEMALTHAMTLHAGPARRRPVSGRRHTAAVRPAPHTRNGRPSARRPLQGLTLLVVEDHDDSREFLRRLLEALGAKVLVAVNGLDALDVLETSRPHAILLDLMMPVMDGHAFARRVSRDRRWAGIPIIAVTALGGTRDLLQTWEAGFAGHVTKPLGQVDLMSVVQRVLRRPR
jgi:CheY-like chemotaxis protein